MGNKVLGLRGVGAGPAREGRQAGRRGRVRWLLAAVVAAALLTPPPPASAQGGSGDATLGSLSVSVGDIGFDPDEDRYVIGVAANVTQATVTATANDSAATVRFLGRVDADPSAPGHQRDLSVGANDISIVVTAQDGTEQWYRVFINRGSTQPGGWKAVDDLDGLRAADNHDPAGISSNGTTMWVADWSDLKLYAYRLTDGARDANKDFSLHADNLRPSGIWTDNTTMWVADTGDDKLYAYRLTNGARDAAKDFDLHADNADPFGIWSNGTTMWISDWVDSIIYAYDVASGARDVAKDIEVDSNDLLVEVPPGAVSSDPHILGIWSDGSTMWIADDNYRKLFAYRLDDGIRRIERDIDLAFRNWSPFGIWSDGTTMWVAEDQMDKVVSYNLPRWTHVHTDNGAPGGVWSDGDTIWVNDLDDTVYAYHFTSGARDDGKDFDLHTNLSAAGMWSDGTTIWVADEVDDELFAYQLDNGTRIPAQDIDIEIPAQDLDLGASVYGVWSDGTTIWIQVSSLLSQDSLFAYRLDNGQRQNSLEFDTDTTNGRGVWSDGTTMWIVDGHTDSLGVYAHSLADGTRIESKDFDLDPSNTGPGGMWSDGTTMWIVDRFGDRFYTYDISALVTARVGGV